MTGTRSRRSRFGGRVIVFGMAVVLVLLAACATGRGPGTAAPPRFGNPYVVPEDTGQRVPPTYFLRRAWVQITRDLSRTPVPPTVPLDLQALAARPFAVSWLGHSAMLMRVGGLWVLIDPVLSDTAGPVPGFGPARLTRLPVALKDLPPIDLVLISHDHYDHLDLRTLKALMRQAGAPPRFFVGAGLEAWFEREVGVTPLTFAWWDTATVGPVQFRFVPAQHNSGRTPGHRNRTLWGGWTVEHEVQGRLRRFYFAGDTAYVQALFQEIRHRVGPIDLAALPIGAYQPRAAMRFEHTDPAEAVRAQADLGSPPAFGVHWATFQLGDEEPFQPALDLAEALKASPSSPFGVLPIGAIVDVLPEGASAAGLLPPHRMRPVPAR